MGRSKKTWDALVDYDGNYGVHVQEGIFPGSDGTNIKGTKGDKGRNGLPAKKGEKGAAGSTGGEGLQGSQGVAGDKGEKGDKLLFSELNLLELEQLKGQKGIKGEEGADGATGEKGVASPLLTFRGSFEFNNQFPSTGNNIGDVYYSEENGQYWAWDGAVFQPIGNPVKGEVGTTGEKGKKGDDGLSAYQIAINNGTVLTEDQWVASLKGNDGGPGVAGQKGDKGQRGFAGSGGNPGAAGPKGDKGDIGETLLQDLVLDDYYDKDNVDDLIDGHFPPEYSFHYGYSSQLNNVIETGDLSFLNRDRLAPLYDPGPVLIKPTANIINFGAPPFTSSTEMLIINYPYDDPQNSRSQQYQVVQVVYAISTGVNKFESYIRRCQPSTNFFSEWQPHTFNEAYYYTKVEIENLFRQRVQKEYSLTSETNLTAAYAADIVLKEHDEYGVTLEKNTVTVQGKNGIVIYRKDGKILVDGQALSSGLNYVGPIGVGLDPQTMFPAAVDGDFAIYTNTNEEEAWNGERVVPGDWVIFSDAASATPEWTNLFVGQGNGVTTVDVSGGLLELQGTLTEPIIHLDDSNVVVPEDLNEYPTWSVISKIARERQLGSLKDVSVGTDILGYGGFYDNEVLVFGIGIGSYKTNEADQSVLISLNDAVNRPMIDFMNGILVDDTLVRVTSRELDWSLTTKVLEKTFESNGFGLTFADPSIVPLMKSTVSGWNINILENNEIQPNSVLMWDNYVQKWVAGPQMLDLFLTDDRYLKLAGGGTVTGDIVCSTSVIAGEVVGAKTVEVTEAISAATGTLGTIDQPFKGVDNNAIVTVGKLFDELSSYTPGSTTGDFLPLTGGTLTGLLTMEQDLIFNLADQEPNIRIGNAAALTVSRGPLSVRGDALFTVSANNINTHGLRISNVGEAIYDGDALSKGSASKFFLRTDGSSEMTGDISFKNCGFTQSNNGASLTAQGNFTATRVFTNRSSNWANNEALGYSALSDNFVKKAGPRYTGNMTSEGFNTQYQVPGGMTFFDQGVRIYQVGQANKFFRQINMDGNKIVDLDEPTNNNDAATKKYVDDNAGGGGGAIAHDGSTTSGLGRGAIVLSGRDVLSIVL